MKKIISLLLVVFFLVSGQIVFAKSEPLNKKISRTIQVLPTRPLIKGLDIKSSNKIIYKDKKKALEMYVSLYNRIKDKTIKITFPTSQQYDFILYDRNKKEIYRWSEGLSFTNSLTDIMLKPGEVKRFSETKIIATKEDSLILSQARYFKAEIPGKAEIVISPIEITVVGKVFTYKCTDNTKCLEAGYFLRAETDSKQYKLEGMFDFSKFINKRVQVAGFVKPSKNGTLVLNVTSIKELPVAKEITVLGRISKQMSPVTTDMSKVPPLYLYVLQSESDSKSYYLEGDFVFEGFVGKRVQVTGYLENDVLNVTSIKELPIITEKITVTGEVICIAPGTKSMRFVLKCTDGQYVLVGNFDFKQYVGKKVRVEGNFIENYFTWGPGIRVTSIIY